MQRSVRPEVLPQVGAVQAMRFTDRVNERRLRYSERKQIAETGGLGDLAAEPTQPLRNAIATLIERAVESMDVDVLEEFERIQDTCDEYFGWRHVNFASFPLTAEAVQLNDFLEILIEHAQQVVALGDEEEPIDIQPWVEVEADLNRIFDRHRYAFRIQDQQVRPITSPAMSEAVLFPALLAVKRQGWEQVERSFDEALGHLRGPDHENDDALTAANAALEAALRAMGFEGNTLGELGKSLRKSTLVPSHLAGAPKMIDDLLQRSNAIRSQHGDAHGKAPDADDVPQSLVNLAVHLAGSFIVYLSEVGAENEHALHARPAPSAPAASTRIPNVEGPMSTTAP